MEKVVREGRRIRTAYLDVRVLASPRSRSRIGIIVPRHQHTAVERNRLKRRLRELARTRLLPALGARAARDLAIRARRDAYGVPMQALDADVVALAARMADAADAGASQPASE